MVAVARAAGDIDARTEQPLAVQGDGLGPPAVPIPRLDGEAARSITSQLDWGGLGPGMSRESIGRRLTVICL
jgi:hypothetical protein